jgi:Mn2+/Fe2+ NRAMP family transporter
LLEFAINFVPVFYTIVIIIILSVIGKRIKRGESFIAFFGVVFFLVYLISLIVSDDWKDNIFQIIVLTLTIIFLARKAKPFFKRN